MLFSDVIGLWEAVISFLSGPFLVQIVQAHLVYSSITNNPLQNLELDGEPPSHRLINIGLIVGVRLTGVHTVSAASQLLFR